MPKKTTPKKDRLTVILSPEMKAMIEKAADENMRSTSSEALARIAASFAKGKKTA